MEPAPRSISKPLGWVRLLRPHQWTKNLACLAGLVFGGHLLEFNSVMNAVWTVVCFSAGSSSMYIINDLIDCERDRLHPQKCLRPIPSGLVSPGVARILAVAFVLVPVLGGLLLATPAYVCVLLFLLLNMLYSAWTKHEVLLDVVSISFGFVLRLLAGVYAVAELPTTWITLCTFFLALFLAFSKRRAELSELVINGEQPQRPVLAKYTLGYLDAAVNSTATMTILTYALFTVTSGKNPSLVITVPIVAYAIMHYKLLVMIRVGAQEPDRILLKDRRIQASVLLWLGLYLWITQGHLQLFEESWKGR